MVGTTISHYRVLRALGAGGMGEVFLAEDTKLGRQVALKVLARETAADPDRRARFEREARAIAALNHPNIVTIHSVEEDQGLLFITMELVEGRTLSDLIPPDGMALEQLLKVAIPLADAVGTAHRRGITHRDLKPANVMLSDEGRVKVLDFGLAKQDTQEALQTETALQPTAHRTAEGKILGTVAYMSPEQAQGKPVDQRSDIFSLGVVLFEMATGRRPFTGDSNVSVLSSVLRDTPPLVTELRPELPRELARIVKRCLVKDPEDRYQNAKDLRNDLKALKEESDSGELTSGAYRPPSTREAHLDASAAASTAHRFSFRVVALGVGVVAVAAVTFVGMRLWSAASSVAGPGKPTFSRVTYESGVEREPSLSPDGTEIVYAAAAGDGRSHLFLRRLKGSAPPTDLSQGASGADESPAFSPDGRWIAFSSNRENTQGIFVMTQSGEGARRLVNGGFDPSWTPDGRELVYGTEYGHEPVARQAPSDIWAVDVATGSRRRIAGPDAVQPRVSPNGRFVAFWGLPVDATGTQFAGADREVWIQPLAGGPRINVSSAKSTDWNPAWSADGRFLLFCSDRGGAMNIWRQAVDPESGRPLGEPVAVTAPASEVGAMSVGVDGMLAYTAFDRDTVVRAIPFDPRTASVAGAAHDVLSDHRLWIEPDVSPDGRLIAMRITHTQEDIWVVGVNGQGLRQLMNDAARDRGPRWAPDGSLLFYSSRGGGYQFWSIRPDGGDARQLTRLDQALNNPVPSRDGRWVAGTDPNTNEQLIFDARDWTIPPERLPTGPGPPPTYLRDWSPDGKWLAADDDANELWVFDRTARTWARVGSGQWPRWLPDGRRLVARNDTRLVVVDTLTKQSHDVYQEPGRTLGPWGAALAPDARTLYVTSHLTQADIWTMRF